MAAANLDELEARSLAAIRDANERFAPIAVAWSGGKDSTVLLWLCRKAFAGTAPPVVYVDAGWDLPEALSFRDDLVRQWGLRLIVSENPQRDEQEVGPDQSKFICCVTRKVRALRVTMAREVFGALLLGVRGDELGRRAGRGHDWLRYCGWRGAARGPAGERANRGMVISAGGWAWVRPLMDWTELDVWQYVRREGIPVCPLYFARGGMRQSSLNCAPCCRQIESAAAGVDDIIAELQAAGKSPPHEAAPGDDPAIVLERLRELGYL